MHITKTICAFVCISLSTNAFSSDQLSPRLAEPSRETATTLLAATVLISTEVAGGYYYGSRRCQRLQRQLDQDRQTIRQLRQQITESQLRARQQQSAALANRQPPIQLPVQQRDTLRQLLGELNTAQRIAGLVAPVVTALVSYMF